MSDPAWEMNLLRSHQASAASILPPTYSQPGAELRTGPVCSCVIFGASTRGRTTLIVTSGRWAGRCENGARG
jgi:hypothetical protein